MIIFVLFFCIEILLQRLVLAVSWQGNELKIYMQRETPIGAFN